MVYLIVLLLCIICGYQPAFYRNSVTTFWTLLGHLVLIVFKVNRHFSASLNHFICSWKIPRFLPVTSLQISGWNCIKFKIILHRIISVVWSTSFSPETWTLTRHDEESRRLALSVKPSWNGRVQFVSRFTILRIVLLVWTLAEEPVVFWVVFVFNWIIIALSCWKRVQVSNWIYFNSGNGHQNGRNKKQISKVFACWKKKVVQGLCGF